MSFNFNPLFSRRNLFVVLGFAALMLAYHLIYGQFFPNRNGLMGHDWNLSGWLSGIQTYRNQGVELWRATSDPGLCGAGVGVNFGFPITFSDWLTYWEVSPVLGTYLNFLSYAILGFWGMYFLLRNSFQAGVIISFLGASLFLFNEFYAVRIIIGHLFYPVMLIPWVMYFLTRNTKEGHEVSNEILNGIIAGAVLFYAWMSGLIYVILVFSMSMVILAILAIFSGSKVRSIVLRTVIAVLVAVSWSWLLLSQSYFSDALSLALAQRESYSLQGFISLWQALKIIVLVLFYGPKNIVDSYGAVITNLNIYQGQHELEYGVGPAAFLLLGAGAYCSIVAWLNRSVFFEIEWWRRNGVWLVLLIAMLLFPLLYTTYSPITTPFWKSLPVINSTTSPQRIYFIYSVAVVVIVAMLLQKYLPSKVHLPVTIAAIIMTVGATAVKDRSYYHNQPYDPKPVEEQFALLKQGQSLPAIELVSLLVNEKGQPIHNQMLEANAFTQGKQPMGCYVPGYSSQPVEMVKQLHPGSIWDEKNGLLNIKNPACKTWPKENGCAPGDHFQSSQRDWVEKYVNRQPFPVVVSERQLQANWISILSMLITIVIFAAVVTLRWKQARREPS